MLNKDVSAGKSVVPKGSGQGVVKDSEVDSNSTAEPIVANYDNKEKINGVDLLMAGRNKNKPEIRKKKDNNPYYYNNENIKEKNYRSSFLLFVVMILLGILGFILNIFLPDILILFNIPREYLLIITLIILLSIYLYNFRRIAAGGNI